jgi:hypothetical protein
MIYLFKPPRGRIPHHFQDGLKPAAREGTPVVLKKRADIEGQRTGNGDMNKGRGILYS